MKTESGFEFEINEECLDDYEMIEELTKLGDNDPTRLPKAIKRLIGEEGHDRLKEHCRGANGIVSAKKMSAEMMEILRKSNEEDPEIKN